MAKDPEKIAMIVDQIINRGKGRGVPKIPYNSRRKKVSDEELARALQAAGGMVSYTAIITGLCPTTVRKRIRESEKLSSLQQDIMEMRVDIAESKLDKKIHEEEWKAIQFMLETQGKDRGYVKRQEMSGPDGGKLEFIFSSEEEDNDI